MSRFSEIVTKWLFRQPRADTENCRRQTGGKRAHCNTGKDGLVITFHDDDSDHHCHCHLYWYCHQVRYAQTDSHYDLQTNISVITLRSSIKWWKHLKLPHIISNIKHLDWKWTDSFQFENSNYLKEYFQVIQTFSSKESTTADTLATGMSTERESLTLKTRRSIWWEWNTTTFCKHHFHQHGN